MLKETAILKPHLIIPTEQLALLSDFELKLFRNYYKNNSDKKSFVFAPANTALTLGLLANGAAKQSQTNIVNALSDELVLDSENQCSSYFQSRLKAFSSDGTNTD